MPWTKLTDQFHDDPRIRSTWLACPPSLGLHVMALTYSAAHLLDGHVDQSWVREKIPGAAARRKAIAALVDSGLWLVNGDGWVIRNYLRYNPSRAKVEEDRRADSERKARGRQSDSRESPAGIQTDSARIPPVPSRPVPSSPTEKNTGEVEQVWESWLAATGRSRSVLDAKRKRIIDAALKSHGLDDCLAAVRNIGADPWAGGANDRGKPFNGIEHALGSAERIERWRDAVPVPLRGVPGGKYDAAAAAKANRGEAA